MEEEKKIHEIFEFHFEVTQLNLLLKNGIWNRNNFNYFLEKKKTIGYTSSNTGSHSASDGTGGSYSQSNNNGQGTYANTNQQPGGGFTTQSGVGNPYVPGYYGPANLYQNAFGATYSPGYGYNNNYNPHYNSNPVYNPYPAQQYSGFGSPFVPFAPVPSPIEFNQYLNSLQQQYYQWVFYFAISWSYLCCVFIFRAIFFFFFFPRFYMIFFFLPMIENQNWKH